MYYFLPIVSTFNEILNYVISCSYSTSLGIVLCGLH